MSKKLTVDTGWFFRSLPKDIRTKADVARYNAMIERLNMLYNNNLLSQDVSDCLEDTDVLFNHGIDKRDFNEVVEEKMDELDQLTDENFASGQENPQDYLDQADIPEYMSVEDAIIQSKGTTESIYNAGYVMPDGTLIDFSGGMGHRGEDHRQLAVPVKEDLTGTDLMYAFMDDTGAVRIDGRGGAMHTRGRPTWDQLQVMKRIFLDNMDDFHVDLEHENKDRSRISAPAHWDAVEEEIENYYYDINESFARKLVRESNVMNSDVERFLIGAFDLNGEWELRETDNIKEMERIESVEYDGGILKYKKNDFMKWFFYQFFPEGEEKETTVEDVCSLKPKPLSTTIYLQDEMVKMGANYHLQHGMLMMIPVECIDGLDPEPGSWTDDKGEYREFEPGQEIKKPIEVVYDEVNDKYMLYDGNHRVLQAKTNGDKYIKAFVQANDKSIYNSWRYNALNENRLLKKLVRESVGNKNCEDYFDMDDIYRYVEFDKPLYSVIAKRKTAQLVYISPKKYIYTVARNFGGLSYEDALMPVNGELVNKYAEDMKKGDKFPPIYYTSDHENQEGRHRAMAAMKLGCESIPVIEFRYIKDKELKNFVRKVQNLSFEEISDIFAKHDYFRPVTKLGFGDLQRYITYVMTDNEPLNEELDVDEKMFGHFPKEEYESELERLKIKSFEDLVGRHVYYSKPSYGEHQVIKWFPETGEYMLFTDGEKIMSNPFRILPIPDKYEKDEYTELRWVIEKLSSADEVTYINIEHVEITTEDKLRVFFDISVKDSAQRWANPGRIYVEVMFRNIIMDIDLGSHNREGIFIDIINHGHQEVVKSSMEQDTPLGSSNWDEYAPFIGHKEVSPVTKDEWNRVKKIVEKITLDLI